MIDIHLFLGRLLQDTVSSQINEDTYYGRIPQEVLDSENEFVKEQLKLHIELVRV